MDGVLVDVSQSYRETIRHTVRHFTGRDVTPETIQDYKNTGGWNNDWALSQRICADYGHEITYDTVVQVFQQFFFGPAQNGLVLREQWIPAGGLLDSLAQRFALAIFTGRLHDEAGFTLTRFVPGLEWAMIVADDDVANPKPAPDGLVKIAGAHPGCDLIYFGDTVDDARSARAAGVRFVGIAHNGNPRRDELVRLLEAEGAVAVLENINEIEQVLPCAQPA
jgi:HAD superfamily hydrolase (TIGR01548 family)